MVEVKADSGEIVSEKPTGILAELSARRLGDGRLALAEVHYPPLGEGQIDTTDLVIFDPDTTERDRLTEGGHIYSADLSPDGSTFAPPAGTACGSTSSPQQGRIEPAAPCIRPGLYFESPRWSPDGSMIAVVMKNGRNADIVLVDPEVGPH
jgi:dipeptidyl aminopeptidase/acylaminoacyl peptidase